ncbi:MAG: xanthine dehydrogenase family protein molybdopterin-binding subunit [Proteobacteria bacterium]|nr:xanthine dehydrogenase family protein molybdopterin-binding subunit [Pseudomonadota bacterium]
MGNYAVIGKPLPRVDGIIKANGEAQFTTDISLPGMLYGKILRSPYPHARIVKIDTSKAERVKGVKAVITGHDIVDIKYGFMMLALPGSGDQYLLARDKVNYIGDEVAAVAAVSEDAAEEALELIEVDYEELPPVFSIEEAIREGAPLIHEGFKGNISAGAKLEFGDVEAGFRDSDYIREDKFITGAVQHCYMEPNVSIADFDSSGKLTLWTSTQAPFMLKNPLAVLLGIEPGKVRVIKPPMGGGFGGKMEIFPLYLCCALLSQKTGRPVRIYYTREEEFTAGRRRHPLEVILKIGVKKDGTIISRTAKTMIDGGAYSSLGHGAAILSNLWLTLPYRLPNMKFESCRVYTNNTPCGAMRGFMSPQIRLASEVQLDAVAEELGLDPLELRIKNGLKAGDITSNGLKISSGSVSKCLRTAALASQWKSKYRKLPPLQGIGVACSSFECGPSFPMMGPFTASSTIFVKANTDGTVMIISGASDIGQGSDTVLSQIVAEELGIELEDTKITIPDTDLTPPDLFSSGSRVTFQTGNAAKRAAADLKQKLLQAVAGKLEARVEDMKARKRRIYVKGMPDKGFSFTEAIALCQMAQGGMAVTGAGSYSPEMGQVDMVTGYGNYSPAYSFVAVIAEVRVDQETGHVKVGKLTVSDDCGRVINPLGLTGQIEGSAAMGLGYTFHEELLISEGKTLNPSFIDYKIPTAFEMTEMENIFIESNDPGGPFGAKESGEGLLAPIAPAIFNAIYDATGIRFKELPLTPEKILRQLQEKKVA